MEISDIIFWTIKNEKRMRHCVKTNLVKKNASAAKLCFPKCQTPR